MSGAERAAALGGELPDGPAGSTWTPPSCNGSSAVARSAPASLTQ